jgi:cyclopropane fatty-acyl-phospholipid synthase-like methyltransferase|tara:strand:- start:48 stop:779 length:732 start_codon:yes stop_codon:yes gene_type:complete
MPVPYDLIKINVVDPNKIELFNKGTRDKKDQDVFRCKASGVIFIENEVSKETYIEGEYWNELGNKKFEHELRNDRLMKELKPLIVQKKVLEIGCGAGQLLHAMHEYTEEISAVEVNRNHRELLLNKGMECVENIEDVKKEFDIVIMCHVFEHLAHPLDFLESLKQLKENNCPNRACSLIITIPHANDALLTGFDLQEYRDFILWSQHMILYTRDSISRLLQFCDFNVELIKGIQRFSLDNHLN